MREQVAHKSPAQTLERRIHRKRYYITFTISCVVDGTGVGDPPATRER